MSVLSGEESGANSGHDVRSRYRMPDEAHPHARTFMQWPANRVTYPDPATLAEVRQTVASIANTITGFEPVVMLVDDALAPSAKRLLSNSVETWDIATDDLWCRDCGPVFVMNEAGELAVSHLNFNGWGSRQEHANDNQIAAKVAERLGLPLLDSGLVGEGGGVETDGTGTLMAHESSWVNENRNHASKARVEKLLLDALGGEKLIWAPGLKGNDTTDYHIDALARFVAPGKVLIQLAPDAGMDDPWIVADYTTYEVLKAATNARGEPLDVYIVPEPSSPRIASYDFVCSYANYYVCNGAVICAEFGDRNTDEKARDILDGLYPGREVVALNADALGKRGGGIHCATQQQPAAGA